MIGRDKAAQVIREYGSNDLHEVIQAGGLAVARLDFGEARFREFYVNGVIFLPMDTESEAEERSSLAHALGHHFLHVGKPGLGCVDWAVCGAGSRSGRRRSSRPGS